MTNPIRQICLQHITVRERIPDRCFSGLEISKKDDFNTHLNKYDVIHIDIQWFLENCENADNIVAFITGSVMDELQEIYPDILSEKISNLSDALSRIREKTGQKFIIIDEWDVLIRDAVADRKVQAVCHHISVLQRRKWKGWQNNIIRILMKSNAGMMDILAMISIPGLRLFQTKRFVRNSLWQLKPSHGMKCCFKPVRELPTGRGFADFVYLPKPEYRADYLALIVELKWNQSAQTAMQLMKELCAYS